jgi:hypothetical protein
MLLAVKLYTRQHPAQASNFPTTLWRAVDR